MSPRLRRVLLARTPRHGERVKVWRPGERARYGVCWRVSSGGTRLRLARVGLWESTKFDAEHGWRWAVVR